MKRYPIWLPPEAIIRIAHMAIDQKKRPGILAGELLLKSLAREQSELDAAKRKR